MDDDLPPDWDQFDERRLRNLRLSHSWQAANQLRQIKRLLTVLCIIVGVAAATYLHNVFWH